MPLTRLNPKQLHRLLDHLDCGDIPDIPGAVITRLGLRCQYLLEEKNGIEPFRAYCKRCWPPILFVDEPSFRTHRHIALAHRCPHCHRPYPGSRPASVPLKEPA